MSYLKLDPGESGIFSITGGPEEVDTRFGPRLRFTLAAPGGEEYILEASRSLAEKLKQCNGKPFRLAKDAGGRYQVSEAPPKANPPAFPGNGKPTVPVSRVLEKLDTVSVKWFGKDLEALSEHPQTIASSLLTSIFIQWGSIYRIVPDDDEAEAHPAGEEDGNGRIPGTMIVSILRAGAEKGYQQSAVLDRIREKYGVSISGLTEAQGREVLAALNNGGAAR